jgi:hypothetical protein
MILMGRVRAQITGGYTRKTLSLPTDLVDRIEAKLEETPGLTISAFMTEAAENKLVPTRGKKKVK